MTSTPERLITHYFKKIGHPRPLFHLFSSLQTNIKIFTKNKCEKCPSSTGPWDLNPRPSEHESPPTTTSAQDHTFLLLGFCNAPEIDCQLRRRLRVQSGVRRPGKQ